MPRLMRRGSLHVVAVRRAARFSGACIAGEMPMFDAAQELLPSRLFAMGPRYASRECRPAPISQPFSRYLVASHYDVT